jgi:hypothetical protein
MSSFHGWKGMCQHHVHVTYREKSTPFLFLSKAYMDCIYAFERKRKGVDFSL